MKKLSLNGIWNYHIGQNGKATTVNVPFSRLPVGHSVCEKSFDFEEDSKNVILKFCGITYHAAVTLNGHALGEMGPYCEYTFDITDKLYKKDNLLTVELEDISPEFGPTEGWENFGGIIRDVEILCFEENYIDDVFFKYGFNENYTKAYCSVDIKTHTDNGYIDVSLFYKDEKVTFVFGTAADLKLSFDVDNIKLWSPDFPELYRLEVRLLNDNGEYIDVYSHNVGFRELKCEKHRFLLNGKPLFLKGVCKHEMFGDSGHCPSQEQMLYDMKAIKATGCNFVRLVHYPHNKQILDIADEIGLMVCEEPGLWWSDTSNPNVSAGSLEVLRRTILRDRNHVSIAFWLCFNECKFTEKFLADSVKVCRRYDPTRLVSGANCMSNEDTLKFYNICGFDFYTMHPYSQTITRMTESAKILNDKPLLFTEWGGHFVYDNPKLLREFIDEMQRLYKANSDSEALAGAFFWEWSELHDFNRGKPACIDGNLAEGLVDKYRNPNLIYDTFRNALLEMNVEEKKDEFWIEQTSKIEGEKTIETGEESEELFSRLTDKVNECEKNTSKMRKRQLLFGPAFNGLDGFNKIPLIISDGVTMNFACDTQTDKIIIYGMTSLFKGYPLNGVYGENAAKLTAEFDDGTKKEFTLKNGRDITTVFRLNGSSRINPVAENSERFCEFGYDKNFEWYVMNRAAFEFGEAKRIKNLTISSENNGYDLFIYKIAY